MLKLKIANQIRRKKALDTRWALYEYIDKNPGLTIYDLSKKLNWTTGKVEYHIKKLLNERMVKNSEEVANGRVRKLYFPTPFGEHINWDEMTNTKKPGEKQNEISRG
jgi:predicted transcriptional regulator